MNQEARDYAGAMCNRWANEGRYPALADIDGAPSALRLINGPGYLLIKPVNAPGGIWAIPAEELPKLITAAQKAARWLPQPADAAGVGQPEATEAAA